MGTGARSRLSRATEFAIVPNLNEVVKRGGRREEAS